MTPRTCLCGAKAEVKLERRGVDGEIDVLVCWVECPVCGQLGPRIVRPGDTDEAQLRTDAIQAWNEMLRAARPSENF